MRKVDFLNQFHECLEIESIPNFSENTNIKELEEYDSMMILSIIAFIDENFATKLTASQLKGISTVKDLMDLVGDDKFIE